MEARLRNYTQCADMIAKTTPMISGVSMHN
jgi:hypothetical protein